MKESQHNLLRQFVIQRAEAMSRLEELREIVGRVRSNLGEGALNARRLESLRTQALESLPKGQWTLLAESRRWRLRDPEGRTYDLQLQRVNGTMTRAKVFAKEGTKELTAQTRLLLSAWLHGEGFKFPPGKAVSRAPALAAALESQSKGALRMRKESGNWCLGGATLEESLVPALEQFLGSKRTKTLAQLRSSGRIVNGSSQGA